MTKKPATTTKRKARIKETTTDLSVYLTTKEAASYLKLSRQFLDVARYRENGSGPPYIKLERAVRYRKSELDIWMTGHDHAGDKPTM